MAVLPLAHSAGIYLNMQYVLQIHCNMFTLQADESPVRLPSSQSARTPFDPPRPSFSLEAQSQEAQSAEWIEQFTLQN